MPPKKQGVVSASITDFFPRRTRVLSQPSQPSSSQTTTTVSSTKTKVPPRPDQEVISVSSASHISVSSGTRSVITVSDTSTAPKAAASHNPLDPMESISSRGGPRRYYVAPPKSSPSKNSAKYSISTASKSSFKRKAKVDSDSEVEPMDAVVHIPRSSQRGRTSGAAASVSVKPTPISDKENLTQVPQTTPLRKKPRISSPEPRLPSPEPPIASSDPGELITVPSSQSDEQEEMVLRVSARDRGAVMEEVDRWRNEARSPISLPRSEPEENMDVDAPPDEPPALVFTPESSPEPQEQPMLLTPQQPPRMQPQPSLPATPVALTQESKTAKIIAEIKAKALAEVLSSPENSPVLEFKELEDSDDEADFLRGVTLPKDDPFRSSSPLSPVPTTTRYSLRDRGTSSAASTSRASRSPSRLPRAPPPRPKKAADPLAALLKEKKLADQRGKGSAAFRQAEDALRAGSPLSDESDNDDEEDWTNEVAAIKDHSRGWGSTSSPGPGTSDSEDVSLNDEDQYRLLGEKQGKAVVQILDSDREKRAAAKGKQKVLGVPLWEVDAAPMDTDPTILSPPDHTRKQPVLALLKSTIHSGDLSQAALLLSSGIFANLNLLEHKESIAYLCGLALSPRATALTIPAFQALSHVWQRSCGAAPSMPFHVVQSALTRLGAKEEVMVAMEWNPIPGLHREPVERIEREDVLYRLVRLVTMSTQSILPVLSEVPDFVMALLLVGMDPSSSSDLQREIMLAVDLICQSLAPYSHLSAQIEATICNKIIKFLSALQPINRSHVVGLLAGGSGRTSRIARWVAHAVLTDSTTIPTAQYSDLPPLPPLIELLSRRPISEGDTPGIFDLGDDVDYDDLAFYAQILSVAISNVAGYVEEEASQPVVLSPPASPGKMSQEKPDTKLTLLRLAIENLHSRIIDTRAAHLDRSRAKAALKQLSMRIHYQQEAALRSRRRKKPTKSIQHYFCPT